MSVLIQQITLRQIKALAKRLQTVIPAELNTGTLSLHQAQAIVAKGLGHANFHDAKVYHQPPTTPPHFTTLFAPGNADVGTDDALAGPPEYIVEALMQRLGMFHPPVWVHWPSRRALINAAVHDAWRHTDGASLTMEQISKACDLMSLTVSAQHHPEPRAYMEGLQRVGGTSPHAPLDKLAKEQHASNVADWAVVFSQTAPAETPEEGLQRLFQRQYAYSVNISDMLDSRSDNLERLLCADFEEIVRPWERSPYPPIVLNKRPQFLLHTLLKGLHGLIPHLTKAHVLDAMAMNHLEVLAGEASPFSKDLRKEVAEYLSALPGNRMDEFLIQCNPKAAREAKQEQHRHVLKAWALVLQPDGYRWP